MAPILVVDDSSSDMSLAQRALLQARILNPVFLIPSAEDCLLYFAGIGRHRERTVPCVALIDLVMSPTPGVELLRRLREMPTAKGSVMVMMSGMAEYRMIQEGYAAGAATFLVKPLSADEITRTLSRVSPLKFRSQAAGVELSIVGGAAGLTVGEGVGVPPAGLPA